MQSIVLKLSEIDTKDRLTVEHYLSSDLSDMKRLLDSPYELQPLSSLCDIKGGKRLPPKSKYSSHGVPYVRVVDIRSYEIQMDDVVYISEELHQKIRRYQLKKDDLGIVIVGATIGKVAIFNSSIEPCNFNENLARISIRGDVLNPHFLLAYLQSSFGQAYISWLTGGSAQAKLSLERIGKIGIPILPKSLQDRIAQVMQEACRDRQEKLDSARQLLDGIDNFVLTRLGLDLTSAKKQRHFTVSIKELVGSRFDVESISNDFDKQQYLDIEWIPLKAVASLPTKNKVASKQPDEYFSYIGMPDVDNIYGEVEINKLLGKDIKANKIIIQGNDVVFARIEPCIYNLKIALIPEDVDEALGSTELLIARPKRNIVPAFLFWILRSQLIQQQISGKVTGTTGRRRLPNQVFAHLQIPKVSLEKQAEIADEANRRRDQAKTLRFEAEKAVSIAKARVELMILGEEKIADG